MEGGKTERELQLEAELDSERTGRVTEAERAKRAEIKAAEEENARLQAEERLKANSIPRPPKRKRLFSTLFKD